RPTESPLRESISLVRTPGVVFAIATAIRSFTAKGDSVLIQRPVYYPFSLTIESNGRQLVNSPLVYKNGRYEIDFVDFEQKIIDNNVKLFLLCSPHNPVGRVWTKDELLRLGDICLKHKVIVVADEIHQDFTYPGHTHYVFASLKEQYKDITITCTAPSKTFNLAGLQISHIFIANEDLRRRFKKELWRTGYSESNTLGLVASQAAYTYGRPWLTELKAYLTGNLALARRYVAEIPEATLIEPEGTYLLWIDFTKTQLEAAVLDRIILEDAGLWLDNGSMFGPEGDGFQRINIACPRPRLQEALQKLSTAFSRRKI
ncbi:MAG: MalY/PatB family protein, partial [Selenomonadaceae bacterium]